MKEWFILIRKDGTSDAVICDPERDSLLDFMYSQIECDSIETVYLRKHREFVNGFTPLMIVDEEGLLKDDRKINWVASALYHGTIVGNVLLGMEGIRDGEPDIIGFPDKGEAILNYAKLMSAIA